MGQLMRVLGAPEVSDASGGCSEPERAGQRRRAMRAHNHARSQRDTPQPDESLEVDQKKRASKDARFPFGPLPPFGGGFTVRAVSAPVQRAGPPGLTVRHDKKQARTKMSLLFVMVRI